MKNTLIFIDKVIKKYRKGNKIIEYIDEIDTTTEIKKILTGIYLIESHYRNFIFRTVEYIIILLIMILRIDRIKNYTIGVMQIGLANILRFYGCQEHEEHERYLKNMTSKEKFLILKGMNWKENVKIAQDLIFTWYNEYASKQYDNSIIIGLIGEKYNGIEGYSFLLIRIIEEM